MNFPAASLRGIKTQPYKQNTPQAAGNLTQKRLNTVAFFAFLKINFNKNHRPALNLYLAQQTI